MISPTPFWSPFASPMSSYFILSPIGLMICICILVSGCVTPSKSSFTSPCYSMEVNQLLFQSWSIWFLSMMINLFIEKKNWKPHFSGSTFSIPSSTSSCISSLFLISTLFTVASLLSILVWEEQKWIMKKRNGGNFVTLMMN